MSTRSAFMAVGALLVALVVALLVEGCNPKTAADVERATARSAITVSANALVELDAECARIVRAHADRELGAKCDAAYTSIRAALIGAAVVVDAWQDVEVRGDITCATVNAAAELALLAREIAGKGGRVLPAVEDALTVVATLGACHRVELDGGRE